MPKEAGYINPLFLKDLFKNWDFKKRESGDLFCLKE
jgi:hypothetical protein